MVADPVAIVVTDLGYGDGGKGAITDFLCHRLGIETVYKHTGGPNSVHHVVTDGAELAASCFASHQSPATRTHLGADFVIKPANLLLESHDIQRRLGFSLLPHLSVDPSARIALPYHAIVGQMREMEAGAQRRGSTGLGVGEVVLDASIDPALTLTVSDCRDPQALSRKIARIVELKVSHAEEIVVRSPSDTLRRFLKELKSEPFSSDHVSSLTVMFQDLVAVADSQSFLADTFRQGRSVMCEGVHGTLIDRDYGFPPHVTRRCTTVVAARAMLDALDVRARVMTVGIVRAVAFRHGPGPFVTQDDAAFAHVVEAHNKENYWQGKPRYGWFDIVATRYAMDCNQNLDVIAATMLDQLVPLSELYVSTGYVLPSRVADTCQDHLDTERLDDTSLLVRGIRRVKPQKPRLTALLTECRPLLTLLGRRGTETTEGNILRDQLVRKFLRYLESTEGLGRPPDILSYGPRRTQKAATAELWRRIAATAYA
jgi:adenylosuccinate synthase